MNVVLKRPVITEKSMAQVSAGQYVFEVDLNASKTQVANAVHEQFSVDVESVRTFVRAGKKKRILRTRKTTKLPNRKFAVLKLQDGQKISGFEDLLNIEEDAD